jgi:hypothetical protein
MMNFTTIFPDGTTGSGSFALSASCRVCSEASGLNDFVFSIGAESFAAESITYLRDENALSGSFKLGHFHLVFTPSGHVQYAEEDGGRVEVEHGKYTIEPSIRLLDPWPSDPIAPVLATTTSNLFPAISVVPEPAPFLLLLPMALILCVIAKHRNQNV